MLILHWQLFHDEVCKLHPMALHLLFLHHSVSPLFKEGAGGNGGMDGKSGSAGGSLQLIADGGGNSPALKVLMHIQTVQIAVPGHIAKTCKLPALPCHYGMVLQKRAIPRFQIHLAVCPGIHLLPV